MSTIIPEIFKEWKHCIKYNNCSIVLIPEFIAARFIILREPQHEETRRFVQHYGEVRRQRIIGWFEQALDNAQPACTVLSIL